MKDNEVVMRKMRLSREVDAYIALPHGITDFKDFLLFCKQGVDLYKRFPESSTEIAYRISGETPQQHEDTEDKKTRRYITDLAVDLEVPDHAVNMSDGLSVKQKWQQLEDVVNDELNWLNREP